MPSLDLGRLLEAAPGLPSVWYVVLVALFAVVFVGSALAYGFRRRLFPGHSLHVRLAARFSTIGVVIGAAGLLLLAARYAGVPYVSMRLWLVLAVLAVPVYAGYLLYFLRVRYPPLLAAYRAEESRRRFIKPALATGGGRRRPKKRRR